ncbi:hypothetical protein [Streptomyces alfalfae]|uniref:hypothetical protein n=1 Tax=Streptomyces alfalfae TaxID=1642299 RepID=UPI002812530A|nr:hypothetical protein [Streptomyces alfalfae]
MALDEEPTSTATYFPSLAASRDAGTAWTCRCGEPNPGDYDTCHFCQHPQPDPQPAARPGTVFTPTDDDMEGAYAGVLVASLGEDGDALALTGFKERALEALDTYYRSVCGRPNLLDDADRPLTDAYFFLDSGHAVFTRHADGGWTAAPTAEDAEGAVAVTWFRSADGPVPAPYGRHDQPKLPLG